VSVKPGQKRCVIKSIKAAYTLSARSLVKHLKGDETADLHIISARSLVKKMKGDEASDRITSGSPMLRDNAKRRIPVSHEYPPRVLNLGSLCWETNGQSTGPVRHSETW
jgi:hypothetical protein